KVFEELGDTDLNVYLLSGKLDNPGGFNMLSIDDYSKLIEELSAKGIKQGTKAFDDYVWDNYNRQWLESALQRGDDVTLWSDPKNLLKTKYEDGIIGVSFYERELNFLKENAKRYKYDYN